MDPSMQLGYDTACPSLDGVELRSPAFGSSASSSSKRKSVSTPGTSISGHSQHSSSPKSTKHHRDRERNRVVRKAKNKPDFARLTGQI